ncbi:MAG: MOSC domain-containing protein [Holophagaceae bacterium]|uniref:MOSC domain-containing protein n=1 Tax=Candidatus Geothrix skivensis TaxID=2954439 RepID=A0A9D7XGN1_9BACT|nr:MOSC domain-containing protein [Candidatus Geothrix skivensis]
MSQGRIESIHIASTAEAVMRGVDEAIAIAGLGLEGDRYTLGTGTFSPKPKPSRQITLIEAEAIEALERELGMLLTPGETRRNLVTRGVALNHLVGRDFTVGEVRLRGHELCEPCGDLARMTGKPQILPGLTHRGGLRAEILEGGRIRVGDPVG